MISLLLASAALGAPPTLNIRVEGDGYLRFARGTNLLYAKSAILSPSSKGLISSDGSILVPRLVTPAGLTSLTCSLDGTISGRVNGAAQTLGRLVIAQFSTKPSFVKVGALLSTLTKPTLSNPGEGLSGVIRPVTKQLIAQAKPSTGTAANRFASLDPMPTQVIVRPETEIQDEYITLGAIAEITGEPKIVETLKNVNFGKTPYFGTWRGLTLVGVKASISAAQVDIKKIDITVPGGAKVARKGQQVQSDAIDAAVASAFEQKYGIKPELTLRSKQGPVPIPVGDFVIDPTNFQIKDGEVMTSVEIRVNKKLAAQLQLTYSAAGMAQVKRGDTVRLRMLSAAAKVEVSAKAQGNAYLGQKVTVLTETGASLTGTLIGPNLVEVKL